MHVVTARFDEEEALADPWAKVELDLCFLLCHHGIMLHRVLYLRKGCHVYSIDHEKMHDFRAAFDLLLSQEDTKKEGAEENEREKLLLLFGRQRDGLAGWAVGGV